MNYTQQERRRDGTGDDCAKDCNNIKEIDDKLMGDDRELAQALRSESTKDQDDQKEDTTNDNY